MSLLPTPYYGAPPPAEQQPGEFCQYCGAPLNPFFYFCLGCATPYKPANSVVTPAMPRQLADSELVQRKAPHVATVFWTYFIVIVGTGVICDLSFRKERLDLQIFLSDLAVAVTTFVVGFIYRSSLIAQFGRFGFDRLEAYAGILMLAPLLGLNYLYHGWIKSLVPPGTKNMIEQMIHDSPSEGLLILSFCIFPAIMEEIAFRGLIQHWLQTAIAPWKAIVFASALFAAMHFSIVSFPYLFLVGAVLGWTKWKTESLYPSMLIHFLHNFLVIEYVFHSQ